MNFIDEAYLELKAGDAIVTDTRGIHAATSLKKYRRVQLGLVYADRDYDMSADYNISNLVNKLNIDLYTHVINWEEYKNLMQAFFDADVIDVELLYDNAMLAVNYQQAQKFNLKYILG